MPAVHPAQIGAILRSTCLTFLLLGLSACVSMPPNDDRIASEALQDTQDTLLGAAVTKAVAAHGGKTGVVTLNNGLDAFVARAVLAKTAERSLDVQYYLFHRDLSGRLLLNELLKAADRGVRVRLLIDDMDMAGTDLGVATLDAHPNMQVRLFNPFARNHNRTGQLLTRFGSVTRRMHNKSFTADNQMTILGGRNIGDEYFEADPNIAFADMDVLLAGPAARKVSRSFDLYWNHALSYTATTLGEEPPSDDAIDEQRKRLDKWVNSQESSVYIKALNNSGLAKSISQKNLEYHWADVEVFYDLPDKISSDRDATQLHMSGKLKPYFSQASREVLIVSPYFVPGKTGTAELCALRERGVDVSVLTNSLASTDVSVVHAGYIRYRKKLLKCGVTLFEANSQIVKRDPEASEYQPDSKDRKKTLGLSRTSLHAKMFVFDRQYSFIGSLNLDPRSVTENTEIGAIIDSAEIGEAIARNITQKAPQIAFRLVLDDSGSIRWQGSENGEPVTYHKEPHTGWLKRAGTQIMRYLPIESQI